MSRPRGETHWRHRLTEDQVREIRRRWKPWTPGTIPPTSLRKPAREFHISY